MKGKLIVGILITVLIFGCSNPFFPEKDEKGKKTSDPSAPVITGHPQGAAYFVGDTEVTPLTVTASKSGNGQLSYKWYSNDSDSNQGGMEIPGGTEASYTPSTAEKSTTYYYAVVTNTLNGKSASTASNTALIIVSDIPPIDGTAQITGTYKIGEELSVITTGITGAEAPFKYQWRQDGEDIPHATEETYTIQSTNVAKVISCVITHNAAPGSVTADGEKVPYTIEIIMIDEEPGDTVAADPDTGHENDEITIAFTVADIYHYNLLDFDGVTSHIAPADSKGSDTRIYTVNPADASEGVINIIATFKHTDLVPDSITFTDEDHVTGIYGGEILTNAIKAGHLGSGAITYSSGNEAVATVDGSGNVTLRRAGTAIITAQKAADTVYSHASKSYTLTVAPKPATITGLTVASKTYDGTTAATVMGVGTVNGVINNDDVKARGGGAVFANKNAGTGVTVSFIGWTFDGDDAVNYTLAQQPEDVTANILQKTITVSAGTPSRTLIPFNSGDADYGATATVRINIEGIIAGDTVTADVDSISYGILGNADIGASGNLTITYSGITVAQTNALNVPLTVKGNSNYSVSGSPSVNNIFIIDGVTAARAIPVTQNNITAFNAYANTTAGLTRHYKLTQNVTLTPPVGSGSNWTAIGTGSAPFRGSFNGDLHTITNLTINNASDYQGMFGVIGNGGTVERVGLIGGSVIGYSYLGGIAGYAVMNAKVQNCYFSGNVTTLKEYVGGIVGFTSNESMVQNCYFAGNISDSEYGAGGIVGYNCGTVQNCYSTGKILNSGSGGGIVGANEEGMIQNCYATGDINVSFYGGGITGYNGRMTRNCVALNRNITAKNNSALEIGRVSVFSYTLSYNYARTDMNVRYNWNGTTGTPDNTSSQDRDGKNGADVTVPFTSSAWWTATGRWYTYEGAFAWNFTTVWEWNNTTNLPILRNMPQGEQNHVLP